MNFLEGKHSSQWHSFMQKLTESKYAHAQSLLIQCRPFECHAHIATVLRSGHWAGRLSTVLRAGTMRLSTGKPIHTDQKWDIIYKKSIIFEI